MEYANFVIWYSIWVHIQVIIQCHENSISAGVCEPEVQQKIYLRSYKKEFKDNAKCI